MSSEDKLTPEEKLLNLIRQSARRRKESLGEETSFREQKESLVSSLLRFFSLPGNISFLNHLLLALTILSLLVFLFLLIFSPVRIRLPQISRDVPKYEIFSPESKPSYEEYRRIFSRRVLFKGLAKGAEEKKTSFRKEKMKITELIKYLSLLGISWGKNPQALVEDRRTAKPIF